MAKPSERLELAVLSTLQQLWEYDGDRVEGEISYDIAELTLAYAGVVPDNLLDPAYLEECQQRIEGGE
jgi:hypothetical protein